MKKSPKILSRIKRKRPTSDRQREVATVCVELLSGVAALTNPDYHKLNRVVGRNDRLLHAVLSAYAKHQLDRDEIGWTRLGDILHNAICNEIGDGAYVRWIETISPKDT